MISSVFMVTSPWVRAQMGDDARSSADLLSRGRRDYRHHLPVELEINLCVRQQICRISAGITWPFDVIRMCSSYK